MSDATATPGKLILNQRDAAKVLGRSARWLSGEDAPRLPKSDGGGYELPALVRWFVDRETTNELRDDKTRLEIRVLEERQRKLEHENEINRGRSVDLRELHADLTELGGYIRKAGDLLGRKSKITGRDAQAIVNAAIQKYERKLDKITAGD